MAEYDYNIESPDCDRLIIITEETPPKNHQVSDKVENSSTSNDQGNVTRQLNLDWCHSSTSSSIDESIDYTSGKYAQCESVDETSEELVPKAVDIDTSVIWENQHIENQTPNLHNSNLIHPKCSNFHINKILGLDKFPNMCLTEPDTDTLRPDIKTVSDNNGDGGIKRIRYARRTGKPPYTYAAMCAVAILESKNQQLTLNSIRDKLMTYFPCFFAGEYTGWRNSVRHAISQSKLFYKVDLCNGTDLSVNHVWKVRFSLLSPKTFRRNDCATGADSYKPTLQEELGLPPFVGDGSDLRLPPKPTVLANLNLQATDEDDMLNARNDCAPTPVSLVSEQDSYSHLMSSVNSRKRKLSGESSADMPQAKQQHLPNLYDSYQNYYGNYSIQQYLTGYQQSHDYGYYGYQGNNNIPMMQQDSLQFAQVMNQYYEHEQYYRQWLLNQAFNNAGHYYDTSYVGHPGISPTAGQKESVLDLSN